MYHAPDWFDRDNQAAELDALRMWCGLEPGTEFTRWKQLKDLAAPAYTDKAPGVRALGFGRPEKRGYDRASMHTALIRFALAQPRLDALVMSRDLDKQHAQERRASLEEGEREIVGAKVPFCLAAQRPMREAWLLNGFVAQTAAEQAALEREKALVRSDPCAAAERLDVPTRRRPATPSGCCAR